MPTGIYIRNKSQIEAMRISMIGKNSKPKVLKNCEYCFSTFEVIPSRIFKSRFCNLSCRGKFFGGEKSYHYKIDRTTLSNKQERNDSSYKEWRSDVYKRDNFTCRIADNNCDGRIEAHHILGWSEYPELRYKINNGITLCHAHHPRARAEEKRLIPTFMELVSVSK